MRHEGRAPQPRPREAPGPQTLPGVEVWHGPHAGPAARSGRPVSAGPHVDAVRRPGSLTPGSLTLGSLTLGSLAPWSCAPGSTEPSSPTRVHRAHSHSWVDEPTDGSPTSAAGPSQPAAATLPRGRQRAAYRGWRRDGRLVAVRGDGAAYGHAMSAKNSRDRAQGGTVDDGTSRNADVENGADTPPQNIAGAKQIVTTHRACCGGSGE